MSGDLSLSQALGGLRIANLDPSDTEDDSFSLTPALPSHLPPAHIDAEPSLIQSGTTASQSRSYSQSPHSPNLAQPEPPATWSQPEHTAQDHPSNPRPVAATRYAATDNEFVSGLPTQGLSRSGSQGPSRSGSQRHHASPRQLPPPSAGAPPPRRSSRGMGSESGTGPGGVSAASYAGDGPVPTSSEEWKDRGAAVGVRREVDASGRTVVRQVKKGVRDFTFSRILGEGSYSTVYMATDRQTLKEYAIKVLEKRHIIKEKKIKYVNIEKNTLNRLTEHPGVVRLYYTFQDETSLYYVLDMCNGGELLGVLKKSGTFDVECTRFYGAQILDAIEYMHSRGIIHRDLKPENVLLDDQMHVKITDFGTAKLLKDPRETTSSGNQDRGMPDPDRREEEDDGRAASFVGTAEYVSPELLTHKSACKASDLWAFGCIIYQLLAGRPPFKAGSEYLTFQKIVHLEYDFPQGFPLAARDLVERCLVLEPARRLTIEHIKNHEFFDGQQFGKGLWRTKAPRLRPYMPTPQEPSIIQLNGYAGNSAPGPIPTTRSQHSTQPYTSNGSSRPSRIITELPPPTQLDIEWSPVLTRNNERILKLGDLMVLSAPLPSAANGKVPDDGHKKLSRFFGGSTTKKRQRLVMVTSSGRIILAPAGGEEKRAKQELSLLASDASWKTYMDAKSQHVWSVDVAGHHYTFEEAKSGQGSDSGRGSSEEWLACLDRARDLAMAYYPSQDMGDSSFGDMSSTARSSPASTLAGGPSGYPDGYSISDRSGRAQLSKSQASLEDPAPKRNRFSKRQSRNGLGPAF